MLSVSFGASAHLATTALHNAGLSLRNSTLRPLYSGPFLPISGVQVPARGDGISPVDRAPEPEGQPASTMLAGNANIRKTVQAILTCCKVSSPTYSAPAAWLFGLSLLGKTPALAVDLQLPWAARSSRRTSCSACVWSLTSRHRISIDCRNRGRRNLDLPSLLGQRLNALFLAGGGFVGQCPKSVWIVCHLPITFHFHPMLRACRRHAARHASSRSASEIGHLICDIFHLGSRELPTFICAENGEPLAMLAPIS